MEAVLNRSVLVLNRHWTVIHVTNLKRAFGLLFQGYARVVAEDLQTYDFESWRELSELTRDERAARVATPSFQMLVPEVIQLKGYSRMPPRRVKFSRRNIFLRDDFTCQYCGVKPLHSELTIDHVTPKSRGGRSTWENVVLACAKCNSRKGSRSLAEAGLRLKRAPKKPHWLRCAVQAAALESRPMWTKFVDQAYWNVPLREE
jgi:5-methylcytosine-specific restriction endonuclease McrA